MSKTIAEIRFEKSRKRLSQALQNLEEIVKDKIHEASVNGRIINNSSAGFEVANNRILEQDAIIQNLNSEINDLQKNLSELGAESESLEEENKILAKKLKTFQTNSEKIISAIEADLVKIEEVINDN
jgi:hypothetical protein